MKKLPIIGKDLHHPYSILVIFMLMLTLSAYSQQEENELNGNSFTEQLNTPGMGSLSREHSMKDRHSQHFFAD